MCRELGCWELAAGTTRQCHALGERCSAALCRSPSQRPAAGLWVLGQTVQETCIAPGIAHIPGYYYPWTCGIAGSNGICTAANVLRSLLTESDP